MQIDVEKVAEVAVGFEQSSEAIGVVAGGVAKLMFGAQTAGRNYGDVGTRIGAGYDGVESSLRRWSEACKDNTVALRASVTSYRLQDDENARASAAQSGGR